MCSMQVWAAVIKRVKGVSANLQRVLVSMPFKYNTLKSNMNGVLRRK